MMSQCRHKLQEWVFYDASSNCNVILPSSSHKALWVPQANVLFQRGRPIILFFKYNNTFLENVSDKKEN